MTKSSNLTMPCGVCLRPGDFRIEHRALPLVAPDGWVLLDIAAVGICGTDYHIYAGNQPFLDYPRVIGHELSAVVAASGHGWLEGQLVVVNPYISCGKCRACLRGKPNCCTAISVLGVHRDGGLCSRIAVPAGNLYAANDLTPLQAAMVEFLAIGAHAVRRSELVSGDRVLVTGAGPIGLGVALFARLAGAEVHLLDTSAQRLAQARDLFGFKKTHTDGRLILADELADGFDVVFDATGNRGAIEAGFAHVGHGGSYVLVSVVKGDISFTDAEFHKREMRLIGSRNAVAQDFHTVMAALRSGLIDSTKLASEVLQLADLPSRFPDLAQNRDGLIKAVVAMPKMNGGAV